MHILITMFPQHKVKCAEKTIKNYTMSKNGKNMILEFDRT
jgi:ribosomal protein L33